MAGMIEAIVLAGGLGTRLRPVVQNLPKTLAPINGRPFAAFLLDMLVDQGIGKIILATGYLHEAVIACFGQVYRGIELDYSVEEEPLGTGGALRLAMQKVQGDKVIVVNGDTFFDVDFQDMISFHTNQSADVTIALKSMPDCSRYGRVVVADNHVIAFAEKGHSGDGFINGGVYCINRDIMEKFTIGQQFSLEHDVFEQAGPCLKIAAYMSHGVFIDIGIPEDYEKAQQMFVAQSRESAA
jgi:D-glycero-alpha-D-manno-heptose 1-phosphate guanylyltransferase